MPVPNGDNEKDIVEQLRALGYLRNPLETFFVGNISRKTSIFKTNIFVGLKVGLVGGLVLGLLIGSGAAILDRSLLHPFSQYLTLVGMLSIAYAIIACTLGLVGAVILTIVASIRKKVIPRVRLASIRAGMLGSVVTFIYLTLQWQRLKVLAGIEEFFSPANLVALVVTLGIALVIGKMVSLAVLAILCRLQGISLEEHAHPARTYTIASVLGAAVLGFFVILAATAPQTQAVPAAEYARMETGTRVVLIGLDGATHQALTQMLDKMPTLRRLAETGTLARLDKTHNRVPASVWTSIATGVTPEVHKIHKVSRYRIRGLTSSLEIDRSYAGFDEAINNILPFFGLAEEILATTSVKAIWNIAEEKDLRAGVTNWWLSSPTEEVNGFLIGDEAYYAGCADSGMKNGDVYPESLIQALAGLTLRPEDLQAEALPTISSHQQAWRLAYAADESNLRYALKALNEAAQLPELFAVSFSGLDVLEHKIAQTQAPSLSNLRLINDYYVHLDSIVARIEQRFRDQKETVFVIVAEPGLREADNDLNGFVLLSGGVCNVSSDTRAKLEAATIYGVAPTALYLLGLPKSEEMTGNVLLKAIAPSFRSLYKPRVVKSLGRKDTPSPVLDYEQQQERLDRLREMGYL